MLEYRPVRSPRTLDEIYTIFKDEEYIATVYFDLWSMLEDQYYVRFEISRNIHKLTLADFRMMKKRFDDLPHTFFCNVETLRPSHQRFAEFFGFKTTGVIDERTVMEKD